jgi:hypothetical protein
LQFRTDLLRGHDCDNDHYLVTAKVRQRLSVSKRTAQKLDMDRLINFKKLNGVEVKEQCKVNTSNSSAALENLDNVDVDISRALENIRENMRASATES